ncbi:hypothetical protein EDD76_10654 [Kineothrix alysoides]|uniref:DUF3298 domain-containing protein n=1 Tax=Kineothrix alysoides TaxID=1469948 RepID=A0A4R1QZI3_9FIRM|nr:hypothetical protein [Kineothrix alysoides]TCL58401.1 hypothetical protein EDD76_10654 [Kineothrix alysoides]
MEQPGLDGGSNRRYENGVFSGEKDNRQNQPYAPPLHNYNGNNYPESYYQDNTGKFLLERPLPEECFSKGTVSGRPIADRNYSQRNYPQNYFPERKNYNNYASGNRNKKYNDRDKTDYSGLILSVSAAVLMLFAAFLLTVFLISDISGREESRERSSVDIQKNIPYTEEEPYSGFDYPEWGEPYSDSDYSEWEGGDSTDYYMELEDAIRTDLDYSIRWENYSYEENNGNISVEIDYPVIKGDAPNKDILNEIIAGEKAYFEEYASEYSKYMLSDEYFYAYSGGYVTYMDEEIMSVVFSEEIYTDYWQDYGLYCINIDMENGVVINNGSILRVNDEFLQAFREKSKAQNGGMLDGMTNQELMYHLSEGNAIIFYTPLGMEVGMNYDDGYLTVTFEDYKPYMEKY